MESGREIEAREFSQQNNSSILPETLAQVVRVFIHDEDLANTIESRNAEVFGFAIKQA
jgi:hypothetical protein